jgi:hypothetical protein
MSTRFGIKAFLLFFVLLAFAGQNSFAQMLGKVSINDTLSTGVVIYDGDTIPARTMLTVAVYAYLKNPRSNEKNEWTRLRNAVYVTYPYARRAGIVLNDINKKLENVTDESARKAYIKSREKELKKEFSDPLTQLSVYQGRVLMKLINRETGNNCYEIIKDYKGGLTARFYQTIAFFFNSSLKQSYNAAADDAQIEKFVYEVCRAYGYPYKS